MLPTLNRARFQGNIIGSKLGTAVSELLVDVCFVTI